MRNVRSHVRQSAREQEQRLIERGSGHTRWSPFFFSALHQPSARASLPRIPECAIRECARIGCTQTRARRIHSALSCENARSSNVELKRYRAVIAAENLAVDGRSLYARNKLIAHHKVIDAPSRVVRAGVEPIAPPRIRAREVRMHATSLPSATGLYARAAPTTMVASVEFRISVLGAKARTRTDVSRETSANAGHLRYTGCDH